MNIPIRKINTPEGGRVETGVTQFGDDWPGVFIRGDNSFFYAMLLNQILDSVANNPDLSFQEMQLRSLADLLASCDVRQHDPS